MHDTPTEPNADKGASAAPPPPTDVTAPSGDQLEVQKAALQAKSKEQAVDQVEATLAELEKVLKDQGKAIDEYTPEVITELQNTQDALAHKLGHLKTLLESELGEKAADWVREQIAASNSDLAGARTCLDELRTTPVYEAAKKLAFAESERDTSAKNLANWRNPIASIKARHKSAADLVKEITALATPEAHKHGEAYWKLGLDQKEPNQPECDGIETVEGQAYLEALVNGQPEVVSTANDLSQKILNAWNDYQSKRAAAELAALELIDAQDALKTAKTAVADREKNQIPNLVDTLEDWENHKAS